MPKDTEFSFQDLRIFDRHKSEQTLNSGVKSRRKPRTHFAPTDHLSSSTKERKARPFSQEIQAVGRKVRRSFKTSVGHAHLAKTAAALTETFLMRVSEKVDNAYISAKKIAAKTKQSERTVFRHLAELATAGLHVNCDDSKGGRHKAASRAVCIPTLLRRMKEEGATPTTIKTVCSDLAAIFEYSERDDLMSDLHSFLSENYDNRHAKNYDTNRPESVTAGGPHVIPYMYIFSKAHLNHASQGNTNLSAAGGSAPHQPSADVNCLTNTKAEEILTPPTTDAKTPKIKGNAPLRLAPRGHAQALTTPHCDELDDKEAFMPSSPFCEGRMLEDREPDREALISDCQKPACPEPDDQQQQNDLPHSQDMDPYQTNETGHATDPKMIAHPEQQEQIMTAQRRQERIYSAAYWESRGLLASNEDLYNDDHWG